MGCVFCHSVSAVEVARVGQAGRTAITLRVDERALEAFRLPERGDGHLGPLTRRAFVIDEEALAAHELRDDVNGVTATGYNIVDVVAAKERGIVVTADILREAVRRDLEELFGMERLQARFLWTDGERGGAEDPQDVLADYPHVCRSVLNYGVPSFSGRRAKDFDPEVLGRELREVVAAFEPRLKRDTIRVTVDTGSKEGLKVKIEGVLMLSPVPERLRLSTTINLDNGNAATRIEDA